MRCGWSRNRRSATMARRRREFSIFSLSFLDIMSCGFGATILVFLIIDHSGELRAQEANRELIAEAEFLAREVREGREQLAELRNTIAMVDDSTVEARGRARELQERIREQRQELARDDRDSSSRSEHLNRLQAELRELEARNEQLRAETGQQTGSDVRRFTGDGDRQYLTGLKLGGRRILVLLDRSASMLDHSLVNIIRLRNMPEQVQRRAPKWRRAVATVDWISTRLPPDSEYQILLFGTGVEPALAGTQGQWLPVADRDRLGRAIEALDAVTPAGGTSLLAAFRAVAEMKPPPDNVYLITDGLPTQGAGPVPAKASGRDRMKFFNQALAALPRGMPVNVILAPMEGDPMAASAFWQLAIATRGAFLSPAGDWP